MESEKAAKRKALIIPGLSLGVSCYITAKARVLRLIYGQVLFVWLAFVVMAIITHFFINNIMQQQLLKGVENTLSNVQATIASDLAVPEMMLKSLSQRVHSMILKGDSAQAVSEFMKHPEDYTTWDTLRTLGMHGIYGFFDVFGGLYLNDGGWTPPADYVPQDRPWYMAAVAAQGEVVATTPFIEASTKRLVIAYSRRIFDDGGRPLAVIAIDVPLDKIGNYITETRLAEGGYGMLLSSQLDIIAHKDAAQVGRAFSSLNSDTAVIAAELEKGLGVAERKMVTYKGEASVAFFREIENGWYLGCITPISTYYRDAIIMGAFLITLGVLLATSLSIVLLHIAEAKAKADERTQIMLREMHKIEIAEASNKAKSKFLATMSHEIRTPMNVILGITEMELENETLSKKTKGAFGRIYASGYTLLGIINDILDLSKIEAGKLTLMPIKYEIASLINDTAQLNVTRYGDKPIAFKIQVDEGMPAALYGDELRIKQILNNLLSNAFKYTKAGEVTLSVSAGYVRRDRDPEIVLVLSVSDTGQGMTAEQVRDIYDEYSRFNMEANRVIEGTGLGMNITQHLVHLMRGKILVESEPGKGSIFTVYVPQSNVGAARLGKELAEQMQNIDFRDFSIQRMKITPIVREPMPYGSVLIVDDLETNLYVAKGLMASYKLSIDTAESGFEAIEKIRNGKAYDIVFMDHMMPKMDGVEATKILRNLGYAGSIVALTANAVVGQAEMFLENGFDGFLSKPIDLRKLNALLNRQIRDKQPPEAIKAARQQKDDAVDRAPSPSLDEQLAKIFSRDAEKTIAVLEAIYVNRSRRDDDIRMFVISVHAIKSALANIGERELSALAFKLEQAGRAENIAVMLDETPAFLNALRGLIAKIAPKAESGDGETVDEDPAYLREKLLAIQTACASHDKKTAKSALAGLQCKTWQRSTREQLDVIATHLLHSDFEEAAGVAARTIRST